MKKIFGFLLVVAVLFSLSSCYSSSSHPRHGSKLPPGQAKKIFGGKSAKRYAPGQQKKRHKGKHKGHHKNNNRKYDVFLY